MTGDASRRRNSRWAGIVLGVLLLGAPTACATTVEGSAAAEPPTGPGPGPSAAPITQVIAAPADALGRFLEANRLAGATTLVQTTFPERTEDCVPGGEMVDAGSVDGRYFPPGTAEPILQRYGFVAGWGECQSGPDGFGTIALTVELSDPDSATAAARELAAAVQDTTHRASTVLDGAPALLSSEGTEDVVQIFAPVGRTLAYVYHRASAGQGMDGAVRVITDHTRLLAAFTPTPQAEVADLPVDPDGLAPFVLELPGDPTAFGGSLDLESYLRVSTHPLTERGLLAANGFVGAYSKETTDGPLDYSVTVYGFPTSAQTNVVYSTFAEEEESLYDGVPFTLPSIPAAPCFVIDAAVPGGPPSFAQLCYVGYGGKLAGVVVSGLTAADDVAAMDRLLPAQRDLIGG